MVVGGAGYGTDAEDVLFTRPDVCKWQLQVWLAGYLRFKHTRIESLH